MGRIVGDEPCPDCRAKGNDVSGNHLMVFDDGGKYCNRCKYRVFPNGTDNKEVRMTSQTIEEVNELFSCNMLARGINQDVAEHYGVKAEYDGTGAEVAYYYPITQQGKLVAYKKRKLPKQFYSLGKKLKGVKVDLFGQNVCPTTNKKLLITGGQDDMLAAYQILHTKYPARKPSVVSVIHGESTYDVGNNLDFLENFAEIVICMDGDEKGRKAGKELCQLIGGKARLMELPDGSDPNSMLIDNEQKEFIKLFFEAKEYIPDSLLSVEDVYEEAIEMPTWGRKWPWPSLDNLTYGRRDGDGIYIGAGVKAGKTEAKYQIINHITEVEQLPVFLFNPEQTGGTVVKAIAGKSKHKQFHIPDGDFTQQELIEAVDEVKGKVILFNASYSDVGVSNMWDRLKPAIRYAVMAKGVRDVMLDPITQLTDGLTPSETETELRRISNELQGMAQDLGFFYYCFCHLKEPPQGKTHEEGGGVKVAQFRGSRAMAEKTKLMLGIIRDQYADDEADRNTSTFHLLLNSGFGKTGKFEVKYDVATGDYLELQHINSGF